MNFSRRDVFATVRRESTVATNCTKHRHQLHQPSPPTACKLFSDFCFFPVFRPKRFLTEPRNRARIYGSARSIGDPTIYNDQCLSASGRLAQRANCAHGPPRPTTITTTAPPPLSPPRPGPWTATRRVDQGFSYFPTYVIDYRARDLSSYRHAACTTPYITSYRQATAHTRIGRRPIRSCTPEESVDIDAFHWNGKNRQRRSDDQWKILILSMSAQNEWQILILSCAGFPRKSA